MRVRIVQPQTATADGATPAAFSATFETFDVAARTDVGRRRSNNEDNFAVDPEIGLFVLSDGMGGEAAGELASKMAVEEITRHMREVVRNPGNHATFGDVNAQFGELTNHLASAVRRANRVIWDAAQHHATQRGMGATVVAVLLRPPMISITHVGDSRIYLLRDAQLQQLTQDHSLVMEQVRRGLITREEAERNEMRNIIVRALGADENVEVDMDELCIAPGDRLVLCSDGLTSMLNDEGIAQVVSEAGSTEQACERLVQIANDNGGDDNVTVIVLRVMEPRPRGFWGWFKRLWQ